MTKEDGRKTKQIQIIIITNFQNKICENPCESVSEVKLNPASSKTLRLRRDEKKIENKANIKIGKIDVNSYMTSEYERLWAFFAL